MRRAASLWLKTAGTSNTLKLSTNESGEHCDQARMSEKRSWLEQEEEENTRTVCAVCGDKGGVSLPSQSGWVSGCDQPATIMCLSACESVNADQ